MRKEKFKAPNSVIYNYQVVCFVTAISPRHRGQARCSWISGTKPGPVSFGDVFVKNHSSSGILGAGGEEAGGGEDGDSRLVTEVASWYRQDLKPREAGVTGGLVLSPL